MLTSPHRDPVLAVALALALAPAVARAADEPVEDVVVTGQRQAYRGDVAIAETPQVITVIDAQLVKDAGLTGLAETLDLSASMARQNNFGGLWDNFATRGFAGDENLPSGYLVNGFNAGRGFGGPRDVSGLERVEILKGPNAALFGRGEPGGTVNLVTRRPEFEWGGSLAATGGSFDTWRGEGDLTGPVIGGLAARISGFYENAGSFRDTLDSERFGVTPSLLVEIDEQTAISWDGEFTRQEIPFDRGVPALNGELGAISRRTFLGEPGDGPMDAEVDGHQLQIHRELGEAWRILAGFGLRKTRLDGFSTEPELVASRQAFFVDGRTLSRQRRHRDYDADYTVYRVELAGDFETGPLAHDLLLGFDFDEFENSQRFERFRPPLLSSNPTPQQGNVIDVLAPVYGQFPLPVPAPLTDRLDEQRAWGIYLQDHVTIGDRLHVRVGGRFDDFEQTSLNRATSARVADSDTKFSPQAGLVFDAAEFVSLYVAYGEGFRQNSGADAAGTPFSPEESQSVEIGARFALLDDALSATLSLFQMDKTNILTADPNNPGFSVAIGKARSRGIELDVVGRLPFEIDLWSSYAYVDAEARRTVLDPNFSLVIEKGDALINVPEHSFNVLVTREFPIGAHSLMLGAGLQHVGERLGETATDFTLPDYTLVRLVGRVSIGEALEVSAELNNLLDETYYTNSFAALWVAPGAPRGGSLTIRYRF